MYHSIIFIDPKTNKKINTYSDWYLAPTQRPVITPPELKENYVEIPGASLALDMAETLTGYPTYKNRTGSLSFYALNALDDLKVKPWHERYNEILTLLDGKQLKMYLEDEADYFYFGRWQVKTWDTKPNSYRSEVTLKYNLEPYKWSWQQTNEPWLWDPFSFTHGYIGNSDKYNITVNSPSSYKEYTFDNIDYETLVPTIPIFRTSNVTTTMSIKFVNEDLGINVEHTLAEGDNELLDCIITHNTWKVSVKGAGKLAIVYRKGRI